MQRPGKRLFFLVLSVFLLVVTSALVYQLGMRVLEGEERSFWRSVEWAAETVSTTGYGEDGSWNHPAMVLFVVSLQFVGVFLVFLLFPIYLIPALEERFQARLPRAVTRGGEALLIFHYDSAVSLLVAAAEKQGLLPILVESDEAAARRLVEIGHTVVYGSHEDGVLENVHLERVKGAVLNGTAEDNATVILALRGQHFEGDIIALVEEPFHLKAVTLAGATTVFTPRHVLAEALAERASDRVSPRVHGARSLGGNLSVREIKIHDGSETAGRTLREAEIGRRTGVSVVAQWIRGELVAPVPTDSVLAVDTILVVAGSEEGIRTFAETCSASPRPSERPFFIAGYGEVGRTVAEILRGAGETVKTSDIEPIEGVDFVGDISDPAFLESSGLIDCQSVVLAVGSDRATLFATLTIRDFAPHIPIIARVTDADNVERLHRAGADFALSIGQISGQLLASHLLKQDALTVDSKLRILRTDAASLAGREPGELRIRERTGAFVVAVERGNDVLVDLDDDFTFNAEDVIYVCGNGRATRTFTDTFKVSTA